MGTETNKPLKPGQTQGTHTEKDRSWENRNTGQTTKTDKSTGLNKDKEQKKF